MSAQAEAAEPGGQTSDVPPRSADILGSVVSSDKGSALEGADVILLPRGRPLRSGRPASDPPPGTRYQVTAADGSYRFTAVPLGRYRLHVRRIGYQPTVLEIEISDKMGLRLSVGLVVDPIELNPVEAETRLVNMYGGDTAFDEEVELGRVGVERWRHREYLESDVRVLTYVDVIESITLGDLDIFRALHRSPGVSTRDDWTSELWIRGAPWGQTAVYFDGLPLLNPVHDGGLVSGFNSEAVGRVSLHPGVRSARSGGGAAGALDIRSRPAAGHGDNRGHAASSLSNLSLGLERRFADDRLGVIVSYRRSLDTGDDLTPQYDVLDKRTAFAGEFPDDFFDLTAHVDFELDRHRRLEVSGIWEQDFIRSNIRGGPRDNEMKWGNAAGRVTLELPFLGGSLRQTAGVSRFFNSVHQRASRSPFLLFHASSPTQPPTYNDVDYAVLSGELEFRDGGAKESWKAGYELSEYQVRYSGTSATPFPLPTSSRSLAVDQNIGIAALWAERRWQLGRRLSMQAGLRGEVSDGLGNGTDKDWGIGLAPRLSVRYSAAEGLSFSAGYGRTYQYLHTLAPAGLRIGPRLPTAHIRVLSGEGGNEAIRADVLTLGAEYWFGDSWLAAANVYARYAEGIAISDPRPGPLDDSNLHVAATNFARGLEFSLRRLTGLWTTSLAYTLSASDMRAAGFSFPSTNDRRHQMDATITSRFPQAILGGSMRLGSALRVTSGAPYTRFHLGSFSCDFQAGSCDMTVPTIAEEPNAERAPWTSRLDLLLDWTREFSGWKLGLYLQVMNLGEADTSETFAGNQSASCIRTQPSDPFCDPSLDEFVPGLSRTEVVGVRISW